MALDFTNPEALAALEEIKQLKARYCSTALITRNGISGYHSSRPIAELGSGPWLGTRSRMSAFQCQAFLSRQLEALADRAAWPAVGREALREVGSDTAANNVTVHHLFVPQIEFESESTARAIWPMEDYAWWPEGSPQRRMHGFGYYRETYQRLEDARWYIATKSVQPDLDRVAA